jgi:hypothetical protein
VGTSLWEIHSKESEVMISENDGVVESISVGPLVAFNRILLARKK